MTAAQATGRWSHILDIGAQLTSSVVGRGLYFALQVFLARRLGPTEFGLYSIGWTVVGLVGTVAVLGMPQAMLRFGIGGRSSLVSRPMIVVGLAGLVATVLVWATADTVATRIFSEAAAGPVIRAFAPMILASGLTGVIAASLRVTGAIPLSALTGVLLYAFSLALAVAAFVIQATAVMAAGTYTLAAMLALAVAVALLSRRASTPGASDLRTVLHFGLITMVVHSSNVLNIMADRVVVGIMLDAQAVGIYQAGTQFAMVMIVLRSAVTSVFEARVPKQLPDGLVPDVTREFFAAARFLLHASAPGLVVLGLTGGVLIRLLFGASYAAAEAPLLVLVAGQLAATFLGPSLTALHMTGGERLVLWLSFGGLVLNLAASVALIPLLGTAGAAGASVIANLAVAAACLVMLARSGRLRFVLTWLWDIALATAASALVCLAVVRIAGPPSMAGIGLMLTLAYATYGVVVAITCTVEDEALDLFRSGRLRLLGWAGRRCGGDLLASFAGRKGRSVKGAESE